MLQNVESPAASVGSGSPVIKSGEVTQQHTPPNVQARYEVPHKYVYVLVRADLSLRQQLVQAVHAALEAGYYFRDERNPEDEHWLVLGTIKNLAELDATAAHLSKHSIKFYTFYEPDDNLGDTALATQPLTQAQRRPLKRFRLWSDPTPLKHLEEVTNDLTP